MKGEKLLDVG